MKGLSPYLELSLFLVPILYSRHSRRDPGLPRTKGFQTPKEKELGLKGGDEALLPKLVDKWGDLAEEVHELHPEVPTSLLLAVIHVESRGKPRSVSPAGEEGLMQLPGSVQDHFGVSDPFDPFDNVEGGAEYLEYLMERYPGDLKGVIAAYEWNPRRYDEIRIGQRPMPAFLREYVTRVKALSLLYQDSLESFE